ncbi:hypothetical protein [Nocardia spumae]|uniref:hypothetical protein n=1 Tax=Nocardia spumae TaxID=2887190 RepID=UPI001D1417B0|nr:hypothetical protein [Nocardia spumae]
MASAKHQFLVTVLNAVTPHFDGSFCMPGMPPGVPPKALIRSEKPTFDTGTPPSIIIVDICWAIRILNKQLRIRGVANSQ